jgi:hypothetical protein
MTDTAEQILPYISIGVIVCTLQERRRKNRMIQDQASQTTNSNNNTLEDVNEEVLQDIAGGCVGCGILSAIATNDGAFSLAKGRVFGSASDVRTGVTQLAIGLDSAIHASRQIRPCLNCVGNTVLYVATKVIK